MALALCICPPAVAPPSLAQCGLLLLGTCLSSGPTARHACEQQTLLHMLHSLCPAVSVLGAGRTARRRRSGGPATRPPLEKQSQLHDR